MNNENKQKLINFINELSKYPGGMFDLFSLDTHSFPEVNFENFNKWLNDSKTSCFIKLRSKLFLNFIEERYVQCSKYCEVNSWTIDCWNAITMSAAMYGDEHRIFLDGFMTLHFLHYLYPAETTEVITNIECSTQFSTEVVNYVEPRTQNMKITAAAKTCAMQLEQVIYNFYTYFEASQQALLSHMDQEWERIKDYLTSYQGIC